MSDEITNEHNSEHSEELSAPLESSSEEAEREDQFVAWESHQKLLNQRKADQRRAKELEKQYRELQQQLKEQEHRKLEEKQEYKKLYEASQSELDRLRAEQQEKQRIMVNKEKQAALVKELGGLHREEYIRFADLDAIVIEDSGEIDRNSVRLEANRFRESYPQLIKSETPVRINSQAPSGPSQTLNNQKSAGQMSTSEREHVKRQMLLNKLKK